MFEEFSSRYFVGKLDAYPDARSHAAINRAVYETILNHVGGNDVVLKIENRHFTVSADGAIGYTDLALPVSLLEDLALELGFEAEPTTVLVARDSDVGRVAGL